MSFSSNLKNELCRVRLDGADSKNALLAGIVFAIGKTDASGRLSIASESSDAIKLVLKLVKNEYAEEIRFRGDENSPFSGKKIYEIRFMPNPKFRREVEFEREDFKFQSSIGFFLRGVFLGVGSITDPGRAYHLELALKEEAKADWISSMLQNNYGLKAGVVMRKNSFICYLKEAENISDFLAAIGSVGTLLEFENTRAYKQIVNKINRVINCDTANINKVTDAATVQLEAIQILKEAEALKKLGEKYVEIAELRLENPELSLTDLGGLADPPITKSGANHRMKKILSEAMRIKKSMRGEHF